MSKGLQKWRAEQSAVYLERIRGMAKRLKSLTCAAAEQRAIAEGLKSVRPSTARAKSGDANGTIPEAIINLERIAQESTELCELFGHEISAVKRALARLESQELAAVLEMHYLACASWSTCAEMFNYSRSTMFEKRELALSMFFDVMPEAPKDDVLGKMWGPKDLTEIDADPASVVI